MHIPDYNELLDAYEAERDKKFKYKAEYSANADIAIVRIVWQR